MTLEGREISIYQFDPTVWGRNADGTFETRQFPKFNDETIRFAKNNIEEHLSNGEDEPLSQFIRGNNFQSGNLLPGTVLKILADRVIGPWHATMTEFRDSVYWAAICKAYGEKQGTKTIVGFLQDGDENQRRIDSQYWFFPTEINLGEPFHIQYQTRLDETRIINSIDVYQPKKENETDYNGPISGLRFGIPRLNISPSKA